MNTFMSELYHQFIKPYLDEKLEGSPYEMSMALIDSDIHPSDRALFAQAREYDAVYAFLLGLRVGAGL